MFLPKHLIYLIYQCFQEHEGDAYRRPTLLEKLAERGCDEETAIVMALDMLFAGIDTSSHLIGFILYELGQQIIECQ